MILTLKQGKILQDPENLIEGSVSLKSLLQILTKLILVITWKIATVYLELLIVPESILNLFSILQLDNWDTWFNSSCYHVLSLKV